MMMIWYFFYRMMAIAAASAGQQQTSQGSEACQVAGKNFQLSYETANWWSCRQHAAECFTQLTALLKSQLTGEKCRHSACYAKEYMKNLEDHMHFPLHQVLH